MEVTIEKLLKTYKKMNYTLFVNGDYNLNIFGIRTNEYESNKFNDIIGVLYKKNGEWILNTYKATVDPGLYYRKNPLNYKGTAILKEGFHKSAFKIGYHQGKYKALVQNKPLPLYRDNNKDDKLDHMKIYEETAGINIHRATNTKNMTSILVDKWSAGCQVIASYNDFDDFMKLIDLSSKKYGKTFSYTLFNEKDFE